MKSLLKQLPEHKATLALIIAIVGVIALGIWGFNKVVVQKQAAEIQVEEVDLSFNPDGPYALIYPRRDGNAIVLNIKRTAAYSGISYELAYTDEEGIDRGVSGTIDTNEGKGEYEQDILFGTCSKNVCKYDKGVENGTLTLHIKDKTQAFRMVTQWHLQKPDSVKGNLTSGDNHFTYKIDSKASDLSLVNYSMINDLSGTPKLPSDKVVVGKVYALNSTVTKEIPAGVVTIELAETPPSGSKIVRFDEQGNKWVELDTKVSGDKVEASSTAGGVFTVLSPKIGS